MCRVRDDRYKRGYDLTLLIAVYILLAPFWLVAWTVIPLLVKLYDGGPVIYSQVRTGRHDRPFRIYKFRSMRVDAEDRTGPVWSTPGDNRVTPVGRFLRTSRLDEIPQAINILRGDMSIVGPRPERPEIVARFVADLPDWSRRTAVRPGIASFAMGRAGPYSSPRKRLRYDLFYLERMCPLLDTFIIIECVFAVLGRIFRDFRTGA